MVQTKKDPDAPVRRMPGNEKQTGDDPRPENRERRRSFWMRPERKTAEGHIFADPECLEKAIKSTGSSVP